MKKTYVKPAVETMSACTVAMVSESNAIVSNLPQETPINYGGVDEMGELKPSSRRGKDWDDDEDEDYQN